MRPRHSHHGPVWQTHRRDTLPRHHQQPGMGRHRRQDPLRHDAGRRRVQPRSDCTGDTLNRTARPAFSPGPCDKGQWRRASERSCRPRVWSRDARVSTFKANARDFLSRSQLSVYAGASSTSPHDPARNPCRFGVRRLARRRRLRRPRKLVTPASKLVVVGLKRCPSISWSATAGSASMSVHPAGAGPAARASAGGRHSGGASSVTKRRSPAGTQSNCPPSIRRRIESQPIPVSTPASVRFSMLRSRGVLTAELKRLRPGLRRGSIAPQGTRRRKTPACARRARCAHRVASDCRPTAHLACLAAAPLRSEARPVNRLDASTGRDPPRPKASRWG